MRKSDSNKAATWSLLDVINSDRVEQDASIIAGKIYERAFRDDSKDNENDFKFAMLPLLKALVLRVYLGKDYPNEAKTIGTVCSLVNADPDCDKSLDVLFARAEEETIGAAPAVLPYKSFKQGSPNLCKNMIMNLAVGLSCNVEAEALKHSTTEEHVDACESCVHFPPSCFGGKPCSYCDVDDPLFNAYEERKNTEDGNC